MVLEFNDFSGLPTGRHYTSYQGRCWIQLGMASTLLIVANEYNQYRLSYVPKNVPKDRDYAIIIDRLIRKGKDRKVILSGDKKPFYL